MSLATPLPGSLDVDSAGSSPTPKPPGLLGRLLDQRGLKQDFVAVDCTYTVETRIVLDPKKAWLYRCAVQQDGREMASPPWQPILENLTQDLAGRQPTAEDETRLAQKALEAHLKRAQELGRWIESQAGSQSTFSSWPLPPLSAVGQRTVLVASAALLLAVGGWFGYQKLSEGDKETASTQVAKLHVPTVSTPGAPGPSLAPGTDAIAAAPSDEAVVTEDAVVQGNGRPDTVSLPSSRATVTFPPSVRSNDQGPVPTGSRSTPRSSTPSKASDSRSPARTSVPPAGRIEPAAVSQEPDRSHSDGEETAGTSTAPEPPPPRPQPVDPFRNWVVDIEPRQHRRFTLEPGATPYRDADIRLVKVPATGIPCITTPSSQGDTDQGVFFKIIEPTQVIVAHHSRVKRTPDWLEDLTATGRTWEGHDIATGQKIVYSIFEKSYPAGAVALGSNAKTRKLARSVRPWVRNKKTAMYLVCLNRLDDASTNGSR